MEGVIQTFLGISPLQSDSLSWSYVFCSLDCQKVVQENSHVDWGNFMEVRVPRWKSMCETRIHTDILMPVLNMSLFLHTA